MRKRRICVSILAVLLCGVMFSTSLVASANYLPDDDMDGPTIQEPGFERREEFAWYFRTHNGVLQRRCWSITRGVWVTDWEDSPYS